MHNAYVLYFPIDDIFLSCDGDKFSITPVFAYAFLFESKNGAQKIIDQFAHDAVIVTLTID